MNDQKTYDLRFPNGSTHLIVGPSASGKTFRLCEILKIKDEIIIGGENIKNVVFFYAVWQPVYAELERRNIVTKWINKMPSNQEFIDNVQEFSKSGGSICVIDDFMSDIGPDLDEIVRVTSRHYNTSTFILFQSLFPPHKLARQISLNTKFLHIHKNPRENSQIQYLSRQIAPKSYKWIVDSYHKITEKPYTCLLIDLTQQCPNHLRYRSNYLPNEFPMLVWKEKST